MLRTVGRSKLSFSGRSSSGQRGGPLKGPRKLLLLVSVQLGWCASSPRTGCSTGFYSRMIYLVVPKTRNERDDANRFPDAIDRKKERKKGGGGMVARKLSTLSLLKIR